MQSFSYKVCQNMPTWCKGSHEGLKIPWTVMSVPVRVRPSVQKKKGVLSYTFLR